jgi:hypothetical protein
METPESVSPIVSLAPIAVQVEQSRVCRRSEDGSASINRNDDNWRIHWEGQECTVNIRIDGEFQHDAMFTEITRLAAGGMVELEERSGGRTQRLVIRPAGNDLDMQWQINGRSADFDANARDWYRLMLQEITRTTGLGADERAAAILDRDGPRGLLQEIDELRSDRVRSRYYRAILLSDRIDDVTRVGIIQEAGADIHSDREMARLLSDLSSYVATSAAVRSAVLETTSTLQSDREKVRVYTQIIGDNTLTSQQKATVITSARTVHSDRERNRLLQSVSSTTLDSPELHASYIEAAGTMSSDREKGQALARLLEAGSLNPRQLTALFEAAQTISSDRELARLLITAIETQSIDDRSRAALMRATDSISSTRERERVTSSLARRTR